jgi:hypothetical protein
VGSRGIATPFLTTALDGGELLASCSAALPLEKEPPVPIGQEAG